MYVIVRFLDWMCAYHREIVAIPGHPVKYQVPLTLDLHTSDKSVFNPPARHRPLPA